MAQFTQLNLLGKADGKPTPNASTAGARARENSIGNQDRRQRHGSTRKTAALVGSLIATSILGFFLLESGCSKTGNKSEILAPHDQTPSNQQAGSVANTGSSTSALQSATPTPPPKKVVKKRPSTVTYRDQAYGVSFRYPRKYMLKTGDKANFDSAGSNSLAMNFAQPGGLTLVAVELPKSSYPGTDFASASFQVSVNKTLTSAECSQFALPEPSPADKTAFQPTTVKLGAMELQEVEDITGQEMKQADAKYYHVFENGACYEFALGLATTAADNPDGITPVDREEVFHRLQKILTTVNIKPETAPELTASKPAVPAVSLTTPPLPPAQDPVAK